MSDDKYFVDKAKETLDKILDELHHGGKVEDSTIMLHIYIA
jgi:hypothetical protein